MTGAPLRVLFAAGEGRWPVWREPLLAAVEEAGADADISTLDDPPDPRAVEAVIYAPNSPLQDFRPYTSLRLVQNLWAGVEDVEGNRTLGAPLARMVEPGLTQGMVEWVAGHVLRHHLVTDAHVVNPDRRWDPVPPPLARDRTVAVLGLGELGAACASALSALGFTVLGWSRRERRIPDVAWHGGEDGLRDVLGRAEIVVLLVPLTRSTRDMLDARRIGWMRSGAVLLNPGRGALVVDEALLDALDTGRLAHATLDTFRAEPLPGDHPFWAHPRVTVTPHIASATRPETASRTVAENLRRLQAGEPLLHLVDRREALA